ncbi:hypothetical protein [Streptacidiphilus jiangxiensis]|uniref:Uncharacterized protein n=1 Tax=Streptacidiphilus jiangxiensis TaxID=235985 RepID=A0A1H7Q338_STRJI|nr:hypothetical protein [Streptacidiphilus jiangxiensis]SEL42148.1 hypothetical protein SAMN05414137_108251 [Streptacidiphilus jiangxiensis]
MSEGNPSATSSVEAPSLRWFGTTWVDRGPDYWLRRVAVSVGALVAAVAGGFLMRLAVQGVIIAKTGSFIEIVLILAIAVCSCVGALRTWNVLTQGKESLSGWMADDKSISVMLIVGFVGFVGSLVAYFLRSLVEAPGEGVARTRYELAVAAAARRKAAPKAGAKAGAKARRRR